MKRRRSAVQQQAARSPAHGLVFCASLLCLGYGSSAAAAPLATEEIRVLGVSLEVTPSEITSPRNTPILVSTRLLDGDGNDVSTLPEFTSLLVRGELSGPGIDGAQTIDAGPGRPLSVPPLLLAGNYVLDNLRLVDASGGAVLRASPDVVPIKVIERVIVSQVRSRPLSLDEIRDRGIVIDESNFTAYQFTFGIATESGQVPISFDVAFPQDDEDIKGGIGFPTIFPGLDVPNLDVQGFILEHPPFEFDDIVIPPIPGVIVIPGNIAFLNQFFEVILLVSNVAPAGSQLVVTSAVAELVLPVGPDGVAESEDDPLVPARTPDFPDGTLDKAVLNSATGGADFGPGEDAEGEFLVEGRRVGTHRLEVTIEAELRLPTGQVVPLSGRATGAVVVRNPSFTLTLGHPDVVRAGETYSLGVTITNISKTAANLVQLTLDPTLITGATLVSHSNGDESLPFGTAEVETIGARDAATVRYNLIARKNGRVTAAAFEGKPGVAGAFVLRTGVGDRNIPLSPDTLILPSYVHELPGGFVTEAERVLGLAHSVATAPAGQDIGIAQRIQRSLVDTRALELAEAGLRVRIGEASQTSLLELWLDWLGNVAVDAGFDEIMRTTDAGHDLESALVNEIALGSEVPGCDLLDVHDAFGAAESYRGDFLSVAATGDARLSVSDTSGHTASGCAGTDAATTSRRCPIAAIERDVAGVSLLGFDGEGGLSGEWLFAGRDLTADPETLTVTITGGGTSDISVLVPGDAGLFRRFVFSGVDLGSCAPAVLILTTENPSTLDLTCDGGTPVISESGADYPNDGPSVVGVRQIPEADPLGRGRVVAVLFDEAVDAASLETPDQFTLSYAPGQDDVQAVGPTGNRLKRQRLLPRRRILLLNFFSSISRFYAYELGISAVTDPDGNPQEPAQAILSVDPDFTEPLGGVVLGTVRDGNGNPLSNTPVELRESFEDDFFAVPIQIATGQTTTNGDGFYRFDFVGVSNIGPFRVRATSPDTGQRAERHSRIVLEGERRRLDLLMLGLGRVRGTVVDAATLLPVANATVTVVSQTDLSRVSTRSRADGSFTAENVAVGNLTVSAAFTPEGGATLSGSVAAVLERAGATAEVEVLLFSGSGTVEGTVFEQGSAGQRPVGSGVTVIVSNEEDFQDETETDSAGHFVFPAVPPGAFRVRAIRNWTAELVTVNVAVTAGATTPVNLIFPGTATVVGTVRHPSGQPAAGVQVVGGTTLVVTDQNGNFVIERVGTGTQRIEAGDPLSGATGTVEVDVGPPGAEVPVIITLDGRANLSGTLVDHQGVPQVGVEVFLWRKAAGSETGYVRATTGSGGAFRFTGIPLGSYTLRAHSPESDGAALPVSVTVVGEQPPVVLQYVGLGTVTGVVLDGDVPRVAQVSITYLGFDSLGRRKLITVKVTADQNVGATACTIDCDTCGGAGSCGECSGRFTAAFIPVGADYRVAALGDQFAGDTAAVTERIDFPGETQEHCLTVGEGARLRGAIFLPSGDRAGAGIEVIYSDVFGNFPRQQTTDGNGEFAFNLLPPRGFRLTARDPFTGNRGVLHGSLASGDEAVVDVNLLGRGAALVTVVNGAGDPVPNARVELDSGSPVATLLPRFPTLLTDGDGQVVYTGVPEGGFSVTAYDSVVLAGGRSGGEIARDQGIAEVTVVIGASGTVTGTLFDATGSEVMDFAQVRLRQSGRPDAYVTSDEQGLYIFEFIPLGDFQLEFFDPQSGRIGRYDEPAPLAINIAGQVVTQDLYLLPAGAVTGLVSRPAGDAVPGAMVELRSAFLVQPEGLVRDVSFFGPGKLTTTTNLLGAYLIPGVPKGEFDLTATDPVSGAMGTGGAQITSEGEEVVAHLTLDGRGSVFGVVTLADRVTPVAFATVMLDSGMTHLNVVSGESGAYQFESVPLDAFTVTAREQGGNDGGRSAGLVQSDLEEVELNVAFLGTGSVSGRVLDVSDDPVATEVKLTRADSGSFLPKTFTVFSHGNGDYTFSDIPIDMLTVTATLGPLGGAATAELSEDGEALTGIDIRIEDAGTVTGFVQHPSGSVAAGAIVILAGTTRSFQLSALTDQSGGFTFENVPLDAVAVTVTDPPSGGVGTAGGTLGTAEQVLDLGVITLDNTVPAVATIDPPGGVTGVALGTPVVITFTDLVDPETVTSTSVKVRNGAVALAGNLAVDEVGGVSVVTFTATGGLPEFATVTVDVTQLVKDDFGRPIPARVRSSFQTADVAPPAVRGANIVRGWVVVQWSEAVALASGNVTLTDTGSGQAVPGTLVPSDGGRVLTFKPNAPLPDDRTFDLAVSGWTDVFGNAQASPFSRSLSTSDHEGPTISLISSPSSVVPVGATVVLEAVPAPGVDDVLIVDFFAAGQRIGSDNTTPFTHTFLAAGDVTFSVVATDFAGNQGPAASLGLTVVPNSPPTAQILNPAEGTTVKTGKTVQVTVSATDDLGLTDIELTVLGTTYVNHAPPGQTSRQATFSVTIPAGVQPNPALQMAAIARDSVGLVSSPATRTLNLVDGVKPTARITSLSGDFIVEPGQVIDPIHIEASDTVGVTRITFETVGELEETDKVIVSPPTVNAAADFRITVPAVPTGSTITFIARAEDVAGNVGEAPRITLTVAGKPSITLIDPDPAAPGERIAGAPLTIRAMASATLAQRVEFFIDGQLVGSDATAEPGDVYRLTIITPLGASSTVIGVRVLDIFGERSALETATLALRPNDVPVAQITPVSPVVSIGGLLNLDGSGSTDADRQALSYLWKLIRPTGSQATLSSATVARPSLAPDVAGTYAIELTVSDGVDASAVASVAFSAALATPTFTPTETPMPTTTPTPTPTPLGIADWSEFFAAVWSLDEAFGTRFNRAETTCGADCDLLETSTVARDTANRVEGAASVAFQAGATAKLQCTTICGDEPGELAPENLQAFSWGGWIKPDQNSFHWTLFGRVNQFWSGHDVGCRVRDQTGQDQRVQQNGALFGWNHHVCVVNGTAMRVYNQGSGGSAVGLTGGIQSAGFGSFWIGYGGDTFSDLGHNRDELFVYQGVLTAEDVCRICSCQIDGTRCECDSTDPATYRSTGRNGAFCNSCALPPCDSPAPANR